MTWENLPADLAELLAAEGPSKVAFGVHAEIGMGERKKYVPLGRAPKASTAPRRPSPRKGRGELWTYRHQCELADASPLRSAHARLTVERVAQLRAIWG